MMSMSGLFGGTTIPVLEQVINFAQARHSVLAGNIANMDTPGYRVRDLSPQRFEDRLREAIKRRDAGGRAGPAVGGDSLREVGKDVTGILYHDDSNVSIEKQVAEISKNQAKHNMALVIMTSQFRLLEAAISERA